MIQNKPLENTLKEFRIISCIAYPSGIGQNETLNIVVAQSKCKQYPGELTKLYQLLKEEKWLQYRVALIE